MNSSSTSPGAAHKRPREDASPPPGPSIDHWRSAPATSTASTSSFRNVSACNRCRLRKNRCDQHLPACAACEKASVKCVGYDPITKREIPRSYVYHLETRLSHLEAILQQHNIPYPPPETLDLASRPGLGPNAAPTPTEEQASSYTSGSTTGPPDGSDDATIKKEAEAERLNSLVSNIGMVSVQGASDPRYLGSTSGISFARVVFAAVKSSVSTTSSERGGVRPSKPLTTGAAAAGGGTSMRDSFFGLHSKPTIKPAPFPDKEVGMRLMNLYFEHANPQIPILHRGEFEALFHRAYATDERKRTPRELYMLNIVFGIGAGIILKEPDKDEKSESHSTRRPKSPVTKKRRLSSQQADPLEYYSSAIVYLESFLSASPATDRPDGFGGGLEELQAVLLLAGFALLRPVAPGLWYIIGVAVRLAVDLGLHYEDGVGVNSGIGQDSHLRTTEDVAMDSIEGDIRGGAFKQIDARERGRREWVRDLRRRLWWCVYSYDRIVSVCTGRPFGITDQVITTEFPSLLDDAYISTAGFLTPPGNKPAPSYKHVAHHYFRLRLLQSEILQVLQHQQAQQARLSGANRRNPYMHTQLPSPFLQHFDGFRSWRLDIDRRLWEWKESAPTKKETGVGFSVDFLELNYWQAVIMLYRQSLSVPPTLAQDLSTTDEIHSPSMVKKESREDEESVYLKVAEAGQRVLRLYRQLHRVHLVNYTFLATHHLFMAGISFLYAIWHSAIVRSRLSLDDVDFTVLAATSVLGDLIEKCPPAEACRDAFERMSKATVKMCMSTTGFGSQAYGLQSHRASQSMSQDQQTQSYQNQQQYNQAESRRQPPKFDMNLRDLFPESMSTDPTTTAATTTTQPTNDFSKPIQFSHPFSSNLVDTGDAESINGQQQQQQQQQPQLFPLDTSLNQTPISQPVDQQSAFEPSGVFRQPADLGTFDQYQSMDFLDSNGNNGMGAGAGAGAVDFGFGLGGFDLEGEHDWSEGGGFDLFDGFFFGGPGAGAGL